MRHRLLAAPLLALPLLLAACGDPCAAPALTVSWRFDLADGTRDATCAAAGVATLDVWIDGEPAGSGVACAQGAATFTGLAAGVHNVTIQGYDAAGGLVNRDWLGAAVEACGETRAVARPGQGDLHVAYDTTTGLCYDPNVPVDPGAEPISGYMWYRLTDTTTGVVVSQVAGASSDADKIFYPCSRAMTFRVPYGIYELAWIQDVALPLSATPYPIYQYCTPTRATVHATGVTSLDVLMVLAGGVACAQ